MSYNEYCFDETLIPNDLKELKNLYKQYRDFTLELYFKIMNSKKAKQESPTNFVIGSSLKEFIELLDGMYILSNNFSTKNIMLLTRKLFELYLQIAFILVGNNDEKKALIFVLKNIQINKLNNWDDFCDNFRNSVNGYLGMTNIDVQECIKLITKIRTYNWYTVYDKKIKHLDQLAEEVDKYMDKNIFSEQSNKIFYDTIYNSLSREAHANAGIKDVITINETNILIPFRNPIDCSVNFSICTVCMSFLTILLINYYSVDKETFDKFINIYQPNNMSIISDADRILKNSFYVEQKNKKVQKI